MKISKFFVVLFICLVLDSCAVTNGLWSARNQGFSVKGFFIDKERNRIVLVNHLNSEESHTNYAITDPTSNLVKIFELGTKSVVSINFNGAKTRGSEIIGGHMGISIQNKKRLSKEEQSFLHKIIEEDMAIRLKNKKPLSKKEQSGWHSDWALFLRSLPTLTEVDCCIVYNIPIPKITQYLSSKEPVKNLCSKTNKSPTCIPITKLSEPWSGDIWSENTAGETAIRILATPFAVAADILLSPLYILATLGMASGK